MIIVSLFRVILYAMAIWFSGKYGVRSAECGVRSVENKECGKCGVWKMRSVENAGCGKCGVWKMRGVENAECGKFVENFNFPLQYEINK